MAIKLKEEQAASDALPDYSLTAGSSSGTGTDTGCENVQIDDVDSPPNFEDAVSQPPPFTPYQASFSIGSDGRVETFDEHLNQDGEALYRFLITHGGLSPKFFLKIKGQHTDQKTTTYTEVDNKGKLHTKTRTEDVIVTDFDFWIDMSSQVLDIGKFWVVEDDTPAYRGAQTLETVHHLSETESVNVPAPAHSISLWKSWKRISEKKGLPPWYPPTPKFAEKQARLKNPSSGSAFSWLNRQDRIRLEDEELDAGRRALLEPNEAFPAMLPSREVYEKIRKAADDYTVSPKILKEWRFEKEVYGWDLEGLESIIRAAIRSTGYEGRTSVEFKLNESKIYIRPSNHLSRALQNGWIKLLLIITFILPFIWLFQRFHSQGGGIWQISGVAFALKRYELVSGTHPNETVAEAKARLGLASDDVLVFKTGPLGVYVLRGSSESEWLKNWEGAIREAVTHRREGLLGDGRQW